MKDFVEELLYMCKNSNAKGLYTFIAIMLCILPIGAIAMATLLIINLVKFGAFVWYWAALLAFVVVVFVALILWLKKS